jgi:mannose/fructose/N-acetylgalactosamine-specific phosphotransferase system component IID
MPKPAELTEELSDIWRLVVGYTKQETTAPLRGIGAFLRFGILGMTLFAIGTLFATLAIVRGLQTETGTALTGYWSWVPYAAAIVGDGIIGALAARSVARTPWKTTKGDA